MSTIDTHYPHLRPINPDRSKPSNRKQTRRMKKLLMAWKQPLCNSYNVSKARQAASPHAAIVNNTTSRRGHFGRFPAAVPTPAIFQRSIHPAGIFLLLMLMTLCGLTITADAQLLPCTGIVPTVTATPLTARLEDDVVVNCDMLQHDQHGNTIKAIAYGKRWAPLHSTSTPFPLGGTASPEASVYVEDWLGNSLIINLQPGASRPDVALTDNAAGDGTSYNVAVVYQVDTFAYLDIWSLINPGTPGLNAIFVSTTPINSGVNVCDTFHNGPHIDMWSDAIATNSNSGLPTMHNFAIVFGEGPTTGTATDLLAVYGDINFPPPSWSTQSLGTGVMMPDVACLTDVQTGDLKMEIVYYEYIAPGSFDLNYVEYNTTPGGSTLPLTASPTLLENRVEFFSPRIEAMSQWDSLAPRASAKWQVAVSTGLFATGIPSRPFVWQVYGYNDMTSGPTVLSAPFSTDDVKSPCVAAGINPLFSADLGNAQYTTSFFPRTDSNIYNRSIDPYTGGMDSRWWQVTCQLDRYYWDANRSTAVSNCSNSGLNLLNAWFDGYDILYKESPNAMVFKTTGVGNTGSINKISVYPNPVSNMLNIKNAEKSTYQVSDIAGKTLESGSLPATGSVDVERLKPGAYLLHVSKVNEPVQTIKFIRR